MGISRRLPVLASLIVVWMVFGFLCTVSATDATVLTNLGGVATGTLTGLEPLLQLRAPAEVTVIGPMQQYDIPLSSIRQIAVDFPRLVIETATSVIIGPYSAFRGIGESLKLDMGSGKGTALIPFTSVRAIALHGTGLHAVPREWMGDHFLSTPEIVAATALRGEDCEACTITTPQPSTSDSEVVWDAVTPEVEAPEEPGEIPWWIALLAVVALVVVLYSLGSSSSAQ